jgi:hypothetical protein
MEAVMRKTLKSIAGFLKRNIVGLLFFVFITAVFFNVVGGADRKSYEEEKRIALESLNRAAVTCYAVEGRYPESYEYIKENYGVRINEGKYTVVYEIFAANIMPQIMIIDK